MKRVALIVCGLSLGWPAIAAAHRVDEYLQATRLVLGHDSVNVEIDLTPGASVAPRVLALIDADGDGILSAPERHTYAALVLTLADVKVDGVSAPVVVIGSEFPSVAEMRAGVGTIRLKGRSLLHGPAAGRHQVTYVNVHHPEMSAYLINALMPPAGIHIASQRRDPWQHQLTLDYVVDRSDAPAWRFASGLGMCALLVCALAWFRRGSLRSALFAAQL